MTRMVRLWIVLAGLFGAGAVGMAAVAAHALSGASPAMVRIVDSGVQIQGWHALALLGCGVWAERRAGLAGERLAHWAAAAFALGTVLFCADVYVLAFTGVSLGPTAPTGGFVLIAGWLLLAASALR